MVSLPERVAGLLRARGMFPVIGCEIEFYLHGASTHKNMGSWTELLLSACRENSIELGGIEKEQGEDQYEIALPPQHSMDRAIATLRRVKHLVTEHATAAGLNADFSSKPTMSQPGSGLHLHLHIENENGINRFTREDHGYSTCLLHAIGGLLAALPESMIFFAPNESSYARFVSRSEAPTTLSWGANNRTVALRLPDSARDHKRIEHRVAGSDADSEKAIAALLAGAHHGLAHAVMPGEQTYGDASLAQYGLAPLPVSLAEATQMFDQGRILQRYADVDEWLSTAHSG